MDGPADKHNERNSEDDDEKIRHLRAGLLSNLASMQRRERRRKLAASKHVPIRSDTMGYHLSGASSGWRATHPYVFQAQGQSQDQESQTFRHSDGAARKLPRDEVSTEVNSLLPKERPGSINYWDLAGDMLEKGGAELGRRHDMRWATTFLCQYCFQRVPNDEYVPYSSISTVGEKRKREDEEDRMEGACHACRSRYRRVADTTMAEEEHQEGQGIQGETTGDRGSSQSQQELADNRIGSLSHDNDDADPGGFFRSVGGPGLRSGGVRRVDIRAAQSSIPQLIPRRIDNECSSEGGTAAKDPTNSCDSPYEFNAVREFLEGFYNDEDDSACQSDLGPVATTDPDPLDYLFTNWDESLGSSGSSSSSSSSSSSDDDAHGPAISPFANSDPDAWWGDGLSHWFNHDDTDWS